MNAQQLREYIIIPTLQFLQMDSIAAQNLLLGTAAQESQMGQFIHQVKGPALSIYQIEPKTHLDLWNNYLKYRLPLKVKIHSLEIDSLNINKLMVDRDNFNLLGNLYYATAICRVLYWRNPLPLPDAHNIAGLARLWKEVYNTSEGKGTEEQFIMNYKKYVL